MTLSESTYVVLESHDSDGAIHDRIGELEDLIQQIREEIDLVKAEEGEIWTKFMSLIDTNSKFENDKVTEWEKNEKEVAAKNTEIEIGFDESDVVLKRVQMIEKAETFIRFKVEKLCSMLPEAAEYFEKFRSPLLDRIRQWKSSKPNLIEIEYPSGPLIKEFDENEEAEAPVANSRKIQPGTRGLLKFPDMEPISGTVISVNPDGFQFAPRGEGPMMVCGVMLHSGLASFEEIL
jgi:hypothetical protein